MAATFSIGLDYGTNSVRSVIVNTATGEELASSVFNYPSGERGIMLDPLQPNLARQNPADYLAGMEATITGALKAAADKPGFSAGQVIGIGVDTTGSTPIPMDENGQPLGLNPKYKDNPASMVWLWKDHTAFAEAAEITALAKQMRPEYLKKCGGSYSSEWFWSKILHCARVAPEIFEAAFTWVEHADWMPAVLTGTDKPGLVKRGICAAGHKAMFHKSWGGYPDAEFLGKLDPRLARLRANLPDQTYNIGNAAGQLTAGWAAKLGLKAGIPVAVGAFDAHTGAIGSGARPGTLVKIIGTSTCDLMVAPIQENFPDIPGLCGIVPESVLPGMFGLEAGQSAVGDIFNWFVLGIQPGGAQAGSHEALTAEAEKLRPGQSGLLALDWHNGNRTILIDQRLTGLVLGLTLHTRPAEIYRALIEATAFGARAIVERLEEYGQKIDRVVNCGGISVKNPMVMQIYADVLERPIEISASTQTCALGAAIGGAVVGGAHPDFAVAAEKMTSILPRKFTPIPGNSAIYNRIYAEYRKLHDAFGISGKLEDISGTMKTLLDIRDAQNAAA